MNKGTVLRFLKGNNPDDLCKKVGALPFKIEFKEVIKEGKHYVCFFTLPDGQRKFTNEAIKLLVG